MNAQTTKGLILLLASSLAITMSAALSKVEIPKSIIAELEVVIPPSKANLPISRGYQTIVNNNVKFYQNTEKDKFKSHLIRQGDWHDIDFVPETTENIIFKDLIKFLQTFQQNRSSSAEDVTAIQNFLDGYTCAIWLLRGELNPLSFGLILTGMWIHVPLKIEEEKLVVKIPKWCIAGINQAAKEKNMKFDWSTGKFETLTLKFSDKAIKKYNDVKFENPN